MPVRAGRPAAVRYVAVATRAARMDHCWCCWCCWLLAATTSPWLLACCLRACAWAMQAARPACSA